MGEYDENGIPTLEFLRSKGRERLLTYFAGTKVTPPDDYEEMVAAARAICEQDARDYPEAEWIELIQNSPRYPVEDVLRELGVDLDEGSVNEPAA